MVLSLTEEAAKAGTCARDRRALQHLALNVHVKHSDLTWLLWFISLGTDNHINTNNRCLIFYQLEPVFKHLHK